MGCQYQKRTKQKPQQQGGTTACVKSIVEKIVKAQQQVAQQGAVTCTTSCERSINDLLYGKQPGLKVNFTTIPFMLVCKNSCKYFIGSGVIQETNNEGNTTFNCLSSPVFKARGFAPGSNNCVKLELLCPVSDENGNNDENGNETSCSPCNFFENGDIEAFQETGICITVDLNAFIGITCLDPITPLAAD